MYHFLILGWYRRFNGKGTNFTSTDLFQPSVNKLTLCPYRSVLQRSRLQQGTRGPLTKDHKIDCLHSGSSMKTIRTSNFLRAEGNIYALRYQTQNQTSKLLQTVIDFSMFNSAKCVFMYIYVLYQFMHLCHHFV